MPSEMWPALDTQPSLVIRVVYIARVNFELRGRETASSVIVNLAIYAVIRHQVSRANGISVVGKGTRGDTAVIATTVSTEPCHRIEYVRSREVSSVSRLIPISSYY